LEAVVIRLSLVNSGKQNSPIMMTNLKTVWLRTGLVAAALGWGGCATTPESRVEKNAAAVASWPAEVQTQVRAGKVAIGFTAEQVRVAVGEPDRMVKRTDAAGARDVWVYFDNGPRFSFGIGVSSGAQLGRGRRPKCGLGRTTRTRADAADV